MLYVVFHGSFYHSVLIDLSIKFNGREFELQVLIFKHERL